MKKKSVDLLSIGLVGCGGIGQVHLKRYQENGIKIFAVSDTNPKLLKQTTDKLKCKGYSDYKTMFKREKLDGISICTPPVYHHKIAKEALKNRINVLCEKPLAMNVKEANEMVKEAKKNKKILMTAFCHRFQWQVTQTKKWIKEGKLGEIVLYHNRFAGKFDNVDRTWFVQKKISGGGMFIDTLIHSIDLFRYLVGEAQSVKASNQIVHPKLKVEDTGIILLQSKSGSIGTLEGSWQTPVAENVIDIMGTKGSVSINYNTGNLRYRFQSDNEWVTLEQPKEAKDRFYLEIQCFLQSILTGKEPLVTGIDGLRTMEIVEKAYSSAKKIS